MSKNKYQSYIGIDVSKKTLDVYVRPTHEVFQVSNTLEGFKVLKTQLKSYPKALIVLESTGGYEAAVVQFLQKHRKTVAVVNARQVRDFAKALGKLAKTDKVDAAVIAHFGEAIQPKVKALESQAAVDLNALQQRRTQLVTMLTMEKNRLWQTSGLVKKSVQALIQLLEKQVETINGALAQQVTKDPEWAAKKKLLKTIKGVGEVTSTVMVSQLPELGQATHKEIAALVGVVPFNRDSGQFKGERSIFGGRASVRASLYMATLVGVKLNPILRAYYEKLCQAGKKKKVALVACMHKLLRIMNAMLKNNTAWQSAAGK